MLGPSQTLSRLVYCLVLSAGVHVGIAGWDWSAQVSRPDRSGLPIEIALAQPTTKDQGELPLQARADEPRLAKRPAHANEAVLRKPNKSEQVAATRVKRTQTTAAEPVQAVSKPVASEPFPAKTRFELISRHDSVQLAVSEQQPVVTEFSETSADDVGARQVAAEVSSVAPGPQADNVIEEARPMYWDNPLPEYPLQARRRHWEGEVWLRVNVSASGAVEAVALEKTSGYPVLDRSAERTVRDWTFLPARRAGVPVSCQVRVPVQFQLDES